MTRLNVHGVDLSHHNPDPDLRKARTNGLMWLIHKATEGSTYTDPTYARRRQLAREAYITFGSYAFARPDGGDAKIEALHAFKVARPVEGDIVPALDFEVPYGGNAEEWCKTWQAEMKRLLAADGLRSRRALHYGPNDFGPDYKAARWVPRYNSKNTPPEVPWDIFQFSDGDWGNPNSFPGIGNADLNHMSPDFLLSDILLRPTKEAETKTKRYATLRSGHASLQYSDAPVQQAKDCEKLFKRFREKGLTWVTGTESGDAQLWAIVSASAERYDYRIHRHLGNWVAVDSKIIKRGTWKTGSVFVMNKERVVGHGMDTAFPTVTFEHETKGVGVISIAGVHYPTTGRLSNEPNFWVNKLHAEKLGAWAKEAGAGSALVFVGGDFNMPVLPEDRDKPDIFFDQPFTPAAAELGIFLDTGHGPIDHIASYDPDARVTALDWRVYNDKKLFLHTDHFYVEADWKTRLMEV